MNKVKDSANEFSFGSFLLQMEAVEAIEATCDRQKYVVADKILGARKTGLKILILLFGFMF